MSEVLLRPRWIVAHVVLVAVVTAFVSLGLWQIRRLRERDAANAVVTVRLSEPVAEWDQAVSAGEDHRRARLTGTYDTSAETILLGRSRDGVSGNHVLTPLRSADGHAIVVDRGWVPLAEDDPPVAVAAPPRGEVTVEGVLLRPPARGRFGPRDLGSEPRSFRIQPSRIGARAGYPMSPLYLVLGTQAPRQPGDLPSLVEPEPLSRGPHLSYALQWFAFALALAAAGTYAVFALKARRAAHRAGGGAG